MSGRSIQLFKHLKIKISSLFQILKTKEKCGNNHREALEKNGMPGHNTIS